MLEIKSQHLTWGRPYCQMIDFFYIVSNTFLFPFYYLFQKTKEIALSKSHLLSTSDSQLYFTSMTSSSFPLQSVVIRFHGRFHILQNYHQKIFLLFRLKTERDFVRSWIWFIQRLFFRDLLDLIFMKVEHTHTQSARFRKWMMTNWAER